jgi:hypothetical protein
VVWRNVDVAMVGPTLIGKQVHQKDRLAP